MNRSLVHHYLDEYKSQFQQIHDQEIYKWRAVKQFQDTWDIHRSDFRKMLGQALSKTKNLLTAQIYYPHRMIEFAANHYPEKVRAAFIELYNEEADLEERVETFREAIKGILVTTHPGANHYQDDRAILVYLSLRFPEIYYLYKFTMFKDFCKKVQYDYKPKRGKFSTVQQYLHMCDLLREEIQKDNELLKLHNGRIGKSEYFDREHHILTQDVIYAVARYFDPQDELKRKQDDATPIGLTQKQLIVKPAKKTIKLSASKTNYIAKQKRNKKIGDLGEQLVLAHEKAHCPAMYHKKISHDSVVKGDGLGYDILSFDEQGNVKYIEVKATASGPTTPFFITASELEKSQRTPDNYYLYRLYHLEAENETAEFYIITGDLTSYCINPREYQVQIEELTELRSSAFLKS